MCGIAGIYQSTESGSALANTARKISQSLSHRGPDDAGEWYDAPARLVLIHRRLSILDQSLAGHQPMVSPSGRFVIAFNGEVYNHLDIRKSIEREVGSFQWRGRSDTETLLAAIEVWGLKKTLRRSIGMFAIALWDKASRALTLARDRMGEKPIYYGWQQGVFIFGSELKALKAHPAFESKIDRGAIALQMRHNYIPAPYSIYHGIRKLPPGCCVEVAKSSYMQGEPWPYWSFSAALERARMNPFVGTDSEAVQALDGLLSSAVSQQMIADVPLGAFLSGGIDSSAIVALMQSKSLRPVKTFTIGFREENYNEAISAKAVAAHLGTDHTELYVSSQQALDVISRLPTLYDEPFSDSSQIPTFLVSEMTRHHVKVSLSGDGGDELFGGYNRYHMTSSMWKRISKLPVPLRQLIASLLRLLPPNRWDLLSKWIPGGDLHANFGDKIHKGASVLASSTPEQLYTNFVTHWSDPASLVIGGIEYPTQVTAPQFSLDGMIEQMMALDLVSYLPDDILCKVDRAAMGVSLETRVPMLDHRLVEFSCQLPLRMKIRGGQGKWILRQVLYKYIPKELVDRPKMGFGVPIDTWLRGPLRDWAESLLDESRLRREGYFRPEPIRKKWLEHLSGKRNWQYHLWDVLMFNQWLEENHPVLS